SSSWRVMTAAQHREEPMLAVGAEAAAAVPTTRVPERAEHPVPQGQVGEVVVVHAFLVMHAMALGTLHDEAEPVRRRHGPVVDQLGDAGERDGERRRLRAEPEAEIEDGARQHRVHENLERVLVEAGDDLDALRAVVYLMEPAPQEVDLVPPAMPPV